MEDMKQVKIITAQEAAQLVKDGDVVTTNGFVGSGQPEALTSALEERFLNTGSPKDLTLIYAASQGNTDGRGGDHFAHEGMLKKAILGHWNAVTSLQKLVNENKIQAYNLPQGTLSQYFRDVAAHRLGTITHVGSIPLPTPASAAAASMTSPKKILSKSSTSKAMTSSSIRAWI